MAPPAVPLSADEGEDGLLLCAYSHDGHTEAKRCQPPGVSASCIPGCRTPPAYPPWELEGAMQEQERDRKAYNEMVLDALVYTSRLPFSIEAVFLVPGDSAQARAASERARSVHRRLLKFYAREFASCPGPPSSQLPLLEYSGARVTTDGSPFRLLSTPA